MILSDLMRRSMSTACCMNKYDERRGDEENSSYGVREFDGTCTAFRAQYDAIVRSCA